MNLIEDTAEDFVAIPLRKPIQLYSVGDGDEGTLAISGLRKLYEFLPDRFYRGYFVYRDPPPIPDRRFDVGFCHFDYDGPGDPRCGRASCQREAFREIDVLIEDEREEP